MLNKYKQKSPWQWKKLENVIELVSGQHIKSNNYNESGEGLPYLTGPSDFGAYNPTVSKYTESPKAKAVSGDVLLTVKGAGVGKVNILNIEEVAISRQLMALRPQSISSEYLFYIIKSSYEYFQELGAGSTVPGINRKQILDTEIPVPPKEIQQSIVEYIEENLTKIDVGVSEIKQAANKLDSFWLSYLKSGFQGKLVDNPPTDLRVTASFKQVDAEWDTPDRWTWTTIGETCDLLNGGTPKTSNDEYYGGDVPFLKSGGLTDGSVTEPTEYITHAGLENSSTDILPSGTLLIALYGATTGKLGILQKDMAINQAICAINTPKSIDTKFLFWYLRRYRGKILASRSGGAQGNISQTKVKQVPLPLPPLEEQTRIANELDRCRSILDNVEKSIGVATKKSEVLEQVLLGKSVFGGLMSSDNNPVPEMDEPEEQRENLKQITLDDV